LSHQPNPSSRAEHREIIFIFGTLGLKRVRTAVGFYQGFTLLARYFFT